MRPGGRPEARGIIPAWQAVLAALAGVGAGRGRCRPLALATLAVAVGVLAIIVALPMTAKAEQKVQTWRSTQFGLHLSHPTTWAITEERSDPERGDVLILGNDTSALLVGLLHDTRTPQQMADDLVQSQKEQTPDLAVVQSSETDAGSILMFLQYTIRPGSDSAMLIDEKVLLGTLKAGTSTITLRGMVPDRVDVESQFGEIEGIIGTLGPDR